MLIRASAPDGTGPGPAPWWLQAGFLAPSVLLVATAFRRTWDARWGISAAMILVAALLGYGMTVAAALAGATIAWGLWILLATPQMISDTANLCVIASFGGRGTRELWRRIGDTQLDGPGTTQTQT